LSASWDIDREGSLLGTDELARNMETIREGLKRSRTNALLRDRLAGLSEEQVQQELRNLEQRERQQQGKKDASFSSKLKDELDL
jgi:methionyl-tRNA formyltransferase